MTIKGLIYRWICSLALVLMLAGGSFAATPTKYILPGQYADQVTSLFAQHHWTKGKELLDEGLGKWPNDPNLNFLAGRYWLNAKNYDKARYHLVKACQERYNHVEAKQLLVTLEETTGNYSSAICYVNELLEVNPYSKNLWIKKVDLYKKLGNFEEANNLLKRLNIIYANDAYVSSEYYSVLENILMQARRNGDLVQQEETLKEIVRINPTDVDYQIQYANMQIKQGRMNDALDNLSGALEANPGNVELVRKTAGILMETGRNMGALALARAQMNAHPEKPELRELYQNLMRESAEMERDSDAYIMFTKVYDRRRDMEALQYLLKESQRRGYYEDALMYIDEMRKKVGNNPALVMQEYEVLLRMERKERAYSLIQEAAQAFPKSYDVNLAACRVKMSIASEAMKEERYRDAIEPLSFVQKYCVEPDYKASAARRLFLCYKSINDMDNAEIMLRERMYFDPPYLINIERASLYADKGRKEEALDILYSAWKATPKDSIQQRKVIAGAYGEVALPYLRQSREEGASPRVVDICDIMLEMDSTDYWALRYASGAAKDPAMYIERGFDIYPNDVYFRTKKAARLSQYEGRHLEALEMLQPLVDEFPGDEVIEGVHTDIVLRYTRELLKTKSFNEVAPVLDSALVQHPENKELRYERGVLFEKQRQWDSAYVYQASYQPSFLEQKEYKAKMNALLSRSYKNHVEASLDIMRFADTDQLTGMANIYYSRKWGRNLWSIRFGYTGRDVTLDPEEGTNPDAFLGGRGLLAGLGWSRDFNAKWSLAINGAFANQYFPNLSADATLTRHFANELDAELGAVYRLIEEENSFMGVSAGVNKMWEHVFLGGKVMGGLMHEKLFINGSARFRFYPYYGGKSFLEFQAGGGTAPELSFLNYYYDPAVYNHLNTFLSLGGHWMLAANLEVSTSLSWSTLYNLASEKVNYRNLFIGNVSFSFAF